MKLQKWCLLACLFALTFACRRSEKQIDFYFDPSGGFNSDTLSVVIKVDDQTLLDTSIRNDHINNNDLLKRWRYKVGRKDVLSVIINDKEMVIGNLDAIKPRCADIFLGYDDHSLVFKELSNLEVQGVELSSTEYRRLYWQMINSPGHKFDSIEVAIKQGECEKKYIGSN